MNVTWLGQSGYLFESTGIATAERLLIDPFYSDIVEQRQGLKRLMEPPIPIPELQPDIIFITHNHIDHFDPIALPEIHRTFPDAKIVGPESVMDHARTLSFDESVLVPLPTGHSYSFGAFNLRATLAYHSDPAAVGCVLTVEGKCIYISGDTLLTDTLINDVKAASPHSLDYVFIVINGKLGNMNLTEAVQVVNELQPLVAIPMHYGMFTENTADPHEFASACHDIGVEVNIPNLGEPFVL